MGIFDTLDFISGKILLPLGGMLLAIFLGWVWGIENAIKETTNDGKLTFPLATVWTVLIKYIAPVAIAVVFFEGIRATFF